MLASLQRPGEKSAFITYTETHIPVHTHTHMLDVNLTGHKHMLIITH